MSVVNFLMKCFYKMIVYSTVPVRDIYLLVLSILFHVSFQVPRLYQVSFSRAPPELVSVQFPGILSNF